MIRTLLIDDESKAVKVLSGLLNELCPEIEIIATASSGKDAHPLIIGTNPDLIFLDIAMPQESGFDLLTRLPSLDFEVIFVTGFDEYAINAINFCALGYILKPIRKKDLLNAVNNAKQRIKEKNENTRNKQLLENLSHPRDKKNRIAIPTSIGIDFIPVNHIIRCQGLQGCTKIVVENQKNLISAYNLGKFKKLLASYQFLLSHKSHLVNPSHIIRYHRGESLIEMSNGDMVPVSRRNKDDFLDKMRDIL